MARALSLARRGRGWTSPNPMVGAVLVRNGRLVAEGWHRHWGADHAEVDALRKVDFKADQCDMYVTLEPCVHQGVTPPCVEAIIRAGVRTVHVAMIDPNPLVSGKGVRKLRQAGLGVEVGVLEREARELNEIFVKFITTGRPFVVAKAALSLDGRIATASGDSGQKSGGLSGPEAHRYVHQLRRDLDAILVGAGTVLADDPLLTCRLPGRTRQPLRIVLDGMGRAPLSAHVFDVSAAPTTVATTLQSPKIWRENLIRMGVQVWVYKSGRRRLKTAGEAAIDPHELVAELGQRKIASLLIEGGSKTHAAFMEAGLIDRYDLIFAPRLIGGDGLPLFAGSGARALAEAPTVSRLSTRRLGKDILVRAYPEGAN
ncbi:MAG: bifunctional diaminohydroxyphosphoribosylaminopyrimidine deaminase/5-amino-6-(5-phosphoribosylamino)uracil reductase RibD [Myxococcales bacterium]|nr:MAG: bifunctional diaminohydroxyphosphoribosylaminopyrimidine deaminase/5-amino-6-(5-phosphoribosylamino)uracil reductase RibD [Myxococcales bacterium]